jgi:hypothetical protein
MTPSQPFYPPKLNPSLVKLLQTLSPWILRQRAGLELSISTEPNVPLSTLQNSPCLLLCNHPTFNDPLVMFSFSQRVQRPFYYMAAHERFSGLEGWLLQQIGGYSIRRGQADRESVAQTLKLLAQPDCRLVIFPEGGCSFQNDTVMPFRPGAVQMALQSLSKRSKQGEVRDFWVVPISLKYRYSGQMGPIIERSLRRLEQDLGVSGTGDLYSRLRVVSAAVMGRFEQDYGLALTADAKLENIDWNQRIVAIKAQVLTQCEQRLSLTPTPDEPNRERVYRIQRAIERRYELNEDGSNQILVNGSDEWEVMRKSLARVLNFDALYVGYVSESPTPERFLDTLTRLERSMFDINQPPPKGNQQALVRVGQPLKLQDFLPDYEQNRQSTVRSLTQRLQQTVQTNLDLLSQASARDISW